MARGAAPATPAGQAAAAFLAALAKAARSFTLYDPSNAVVRGFLADYRAKAEAATAGGALVLQLQPFQVLREGEVVYEEADRERSLSFRLFRDGLRLLTIDPGAPWEELLRFLEILAIRFTGVRQQEDDAVTALRKAEFQAIGFQAVEGFVPEEENPEPEIQLSRVAAEAVAPPDFDMPFPALPAPVPVAYRPIPEAALAPVHLDEQPESFGRIAVGAGAVVLREAARGRLGRAEALQYMVEARDFFIADGAVPALADLADLAARQPAGPLRDELLRALGDPRILEVLLADLGDGESLPPAAARLVPLVPAGSVLDLLGGPLPPARRKALLQIVEARLPAEAGLVLERLPGLDPSAAKDLARAIAQRAPDRAAAVLAVLLGHADTGLQLAALKGLETVRGEVDTGAVLPLLRAASEPVRVAAARVLELRGDAEAFPSLEGALAGRKEFSRAEAEALGRALARVHPARAAQRFEEWLRTRSGFLKRAFVGGEHEQLLRWAAVSGLGALPDPAAAARIEEVAAQADEELRRHCHAVLARRRREAAGHG